MALPRVDLGAGAEGAADRGGGHSRAGRSPRRPLRARGPAAARLPRPRHRHRHGQVGHHLPQDCGDARPAPARRRSSSTPPKRFTAISASSRRDDVMLALSYSGETEELLRLLETIKRLGARLIAITGDCRIDARQGGGRRPRLPGLRGGVPAEPGADGEHDRGAGARRRAGDDAARRQGLPPGGLRQPASRAASWASG